MVFFVSNVFENEKKCQYLEQLTKELNQRIRSKPKMIYETIIIFFEITFCLFSILFIYKGI